MQAINWLKSVRIYFENLLQKNTVSRCYILLAFFLLAVILFSFVIPLLEFGRFFGTDDYTHLYHTKVMVSSDGILDFYDNVGAYVSNPDSGENLYNYPFGLWLLGATIVKITGLPLMDAEFVFVILFLLIVIGSFYIYASTFLETKEQQILAVLLLLSMPSAAFGLVAYAPNVFILPFLYIILYIALKEPVQWKLFPLVWMSLFVITISHTGTFIFLVVFSILYFLLYSLLWGKRSLSMFIVLLSSFIIYIYSLALFPQIANQYYVKSTLFLTPGNFFMSKFNFSLPLELGNIFYENMMVNQEYIYAFILAAFIFTLSKLFVYIHRKVSSRIFQPNHIYAFTLPISNISHSAFATPIWIGPIHTLLSVIGFFRIDSRGKCMLIVALLIAIVPNLLLTSQDIVAPTGALREISYLSIIIPITATLGLLSLLSYLDTLKNVTKNLIPFCVWTIVLLAIIITPSIATTYYLPKIAGENYINEGMTWLGNTGDLNAKVIGYGYRTIPIYTNMTDVSYGLSSGEETRTFLKLLKGIYTSSFENNVENLRNRFGVKYILISDKLIATLTGDSHYRDIDNNKVLNKIYSSKDFGVYQTIKSSENTKGSQIIGDNISVQQIGSSIQIESKVYKIVLNSNTPVIEQFGSRRANYLDEGIFRDYIQISGLRQAYINPFNSIDIIAADQSSVIDAFSLNNLSSPAEIKNNQIIYRTILTDKQNGNNEASFVAMYTFYPTCIKREFLISNDWITSSDPRNMNMNVYFITTIFAPLNDFIIRSDRKSITRHIYPNQDSVKMSEMVPELYIYNGDRGIYIKNEPTAVYPTGIVYAGSTLYNYSTVSFSQSESLRPGATLHITQFLSPGDVVTADRNINTQKAISLSKYPDGMIPLMLSGYRTPQSNSNPNSSIDEGYQIIHEENIPYSEIVVPYQITYGSLDMQNNTEFAVNFSEPIIPTQIINKINMKSSDENIRIIGSGSTQGIKSFNDFSTQEETISSIINYADSENVPLNGFMSDTMNYNLDTLKIISDRKIPLMLSNYVTPPYMGLVGLINKNPQMAIYHNEPTNVVLLPISYPMSDALSTGPGVNNVEIFSAWNATINEAVTLDGMTFLVLRAEDIGNPAYTNDIKSLITTAKEVGMTFTTPDIITDHFTMIQNIQYSGQINNDIASINLTNNNNDTVHNVTFRIVLPSLKTTYYIVHGGEIVKTKVDTNSVIFYVSTDIPAYATRNIVIEPNPPREKMVVTMPRQPIEGLMTISIDDKTGSPLKDANVIIDSKYYQPNEKGNIDVDLRRGVHTLEILCPGYETYTQTLNVKGRIYLIQQFSESIPD
jgi:hypothetical protein